MLLTQLLHEVNQGVRTCAEAKEKRENGGYGIPPFLLTDALSVFAAITATFINIPAESALLMHVQSIRKPLDHGVLLALAWVDTRDMVADGRDNKRFGG